MNKKDCIITFYHNRDKSIEATFTLKTRASEKDIRDMMKEIGYDVKNVVYLSDGTLSEEDEILLKDAIWLINRRYKKKKQRERQRIIKKIFHLN